MSDSDFVAWALTALCFFLKYRNIKVCKARQAVIRYDFALYKELPEYGEQLFYPKYWLIWTPEHWISWVERHKEQRSK